jgi:tricorn protease-like protein
MHNVHGVTFDKKGNLWIGEYLGDDTGKKLKDGRPIYGPGDIKILSPDGTLRKVATEAVYSMTTSPDGDVYISVQIGGQLIKITEDGTKTVVAKGFVSRGATFVSDGTCYAVGPGKDPRLAGINKLTKDGKMTQIVDFRDEYGSQHPYSVAIDANGNLFQSDVSHKKDLPNSKKDDGEGGYIFHIDSGGKRSVFMRAGASPAFMAFWPTTNRATKSILPGNLPLPWHMM